MVGGFILTEFIRQRPCVPRRKTRIVFFWGMGLYGTSKEDARGRICLKQRIRNREGKSEYG